MIYLPSGKHQLWIAEAQSHKNRYDWGHGLKKYSALERRGGNASGDSERGHRRTHFGMRN
jgi:hypothetical protein